MNNHKYIQNFYKESLSFLEIADHKITYKLFSYCLLGILNSVLRCANVEPKFALVMAGSKETLVMQLTELFASNFIPMKGLHRLCEYNDAECYGTVQTVSYGYDLVEKTMQSLNILKDQVVIIDGVIKPNSKNIKDLYEEILTNYYLDSKKLKSKRGVKAQINSLPVFIVPEPVDGPMFSSIKIEKDTINQDELIKYRRRDYVLSEMAFRFVEWIEECLVDEDKVFKSFCKNYELNRRFLFYNDVNSTERDASISAWYLLAFNLYLEFGYINRYITKKQFQEYLELGFKAITGKTIVDLKDYGTINNEIMVVELRQRRNTDVIAKVIYNIYTNNREKVHDGYGELLESQICWLIEMKVPRVAKCKRQTERVLCFAKSDFIEILNKYAKEMKLVDYHITEEDVIGCEKILKSKQIIRVNDREIYLKKEEICKNNGSGNRYFAFRVDGVDAYVKTSGKFGK